MAVNEPYKMEILDSIQEDPITVYHIGKGINIFCCMDINLEGTVQFLYSMAMWWIHI